ncbi:hypothetical protein AVEN_196412-1 [Araneus ventricosus]|uniref:Uncharacterized protein n=1 Tax=Araneus ventricosus TaxID=182803 RepID=A0A4Y2AU79_ARAVE|nr:hypothetical protein AVEN_196412-1 [Araneus ventricosus]
MLSAPNVMVDFIPVYLLSLTHLLAATLSRVFLLAVGQSKSHLYSIQLERHGLVTRVLSGESASINEGTVEQWKEDLATLVNGYEPKNIYNCEETVLFYKLMPDRTLTFKGETMGKSKKSGGKEKIVILNSGGLATCTFNEFVDADENLITAQLREIGDIEAEINGGEEDEEKDNDDEEDAAKVPSTHAVALETLETA